MDPAKFATVGIGGYGRSHLGTIAELETLGVGRQDAVVVRNPAKYAEQVEGLKARGVRIFKTMQDLFDAGGVDIISLPTGIQYHVPMTIDCVNAGYDVYCEKPMAAVVQEADRMVEAQRRTGKVVAIGYQAIPSPSIQTLKARLLEGRLGRLKSIHVKGGWPRNDTYYSRNPWVARMKAGEDWILDSPINNACAHQVNNGLYLAGPSHHESAIPASVQAELYRARDIESLDTASMRILTPEGAEIIIALSHVTRENFDPSIVIHAENATAHWKIRTGTTKISYADGSEEDFDDRGLDQRVLAFRNAIDAVHGEADVLCTPENARPQTLAINGAHESCPRIIDIPKALTEEVYEDLPDGEKTRFVVVKGLDDLIHRTFEEGKLFSELGAEWAQRTEPFDMAGYTRFPQGAIE